jgi:hypothetical protein
MDNQEFINKIVGKYLSKLGTKKPKLMEFKDGKSSQIWYRPRPDLPPYMIYTQSGDIYKGLSPIIESEFYYRLRRFFRDYFGESKKYFLINAFHEFIKNNGDNYTPEQFDEIFGEHLETIVHPTTLSDWWKDELFQLK